MKVGIYVRVSTLNQAVEGYSIDEQIDTLTTYCKAMKWRIHEIYTDAGHSGGSMDRPALQKMLQDIKTKAFDSVLVYKLDRLSRSVSDTLHLVKDEFNANQVDFISLNENIDTNSAMGSLFLTILSAIAEFERESITERMKMGRLGRAKSGKAMAWGRVPFGYRYDESKDTFQLVESEAEIIKFMFDYYVNQKHSITGLATELNNRNLPTQSGGKWVYRTVKQMLENPVYIGQNQWLGEIYEGNHDPIISKELFDEAQMWMDKGRRNATNPRPFETKYMLSGIIRCGECDSPMQSILGKVRLDGTRLKYYRCKSFVKFKGADKDYSHIKCTSKAFNMETLEEVVLGEINKLKINIEDVEVKRNNIDEMKLHELAVASIEEKLEKLVDIYIEGMITKEQYTTRKATLEKSMKLHHSSLSNMQAEQIPKQVKEALEAVKLMGDVSDLNYQQQHDLVKLIISEIRVRKDSMEITWVFD